MTPRVDIVLGIHCHQPVGNFPDVIEDAYQRSYRPFIDALERHPSVKAVAHYTGPLWEFFEAQHPEFIDQLQTLVERGQLELLGGGCYEPILAVLPERDALGQLERLSDYLAERFGQRPQGMWLGERVWEPHLPSLLVEAGFRYTALDDFHFRRAGLDAAQLRGRFLTEDQNKPIGVFPISGTLRYLIPFRPVEEVLDHFRQMADASDPPLLTQLDDGEKFGIWPGTFEWVHDQGWLEQFLTALEANADWLRTLTLHGAIAARQARGTVYLPTSSYFEMSEWALPIESGRALDALVGRLGDDAERVRPLLAGGTWRNFLTKYPEVNHLHKRMMAISQRLRELTDTYGPTSRLSEAQTALYRAQCNDAYWHGLFGGAYLPHLRDGIYQQLMEAEANMDAVETSAPTSRLSEADLDVDGQAETVVATERWWACVQPQGGLMTELDDKPRRFNVLNTIARREELYHQDVPDAVYMGDDDLSDGESAASIHDVLRAKHPDLQSHLVYDHRRRAALHDLFLSRETSLTELERHPDAPLADWSEKLYDVASSLSDRIARVDASHRGPVGEAELEVSKSVAIGDRGLDVDVRLVNASDRNWEGVYGLEFNLALLAGDAPDRYVRVNGEPPNEQHFAGRGEHVRVSSLRFVDEYGGFEIELAFDDPVSVWRYPVQTVNNSEAGFELVYQATSVLVRWPTDLSPQASVSRRLRYRVRSI